jgi:ABC-type hemin transport system ATPase subunit
MFADRDRRGEREPRVGEEDLIADLELATLWAAMARGDSVIHESARLALLDGLTDLEQIRYRQAVLADCLRRPDVIREIYALAVQAVADEKQVYRGFFNTQGEARIRRSVTVLELFDERLRQLRRIADRDGTDFRSEGFTRFFETLRRELDDDYFREVRDHMRRLRFGGGVLATARLSKNGQGVEYVLHEPRRGPRLLGLLTPAIRRTSFSWKIAPRDEAGARAMSALRDRVLTTVADAVGQSSDHITQFFIALRDELGFYMGCLNLHDQLTAKGEPLAMPEPHPPGSRIRNGRALYDACLSLRVAGRVQGNDLRADAKRVIVVTGANQGGKSTFLRSLGVAQLMMQAGMFVAADAYAASVATGVFSHYKREEDATMTSGKFDEELARMSRLVPAIARDDLLLCNESFAATNEREGSEIAGEVIRAIADRGNSVVFVTHLYELARRLHSEHADGVLFLRAARDEAGRRSFRITEGEPLPTSYGADLYRRIFAPPTGTGPTPG